MRNNGFMGIESFEFGDNLSGLILDGVAETPSVGVVLKFTRDRGVLVEVPYHADDDVAQFEHVRVWFREKEPPANMVLLTREGPVSLFDNAWSAHSENYGGMRASVGFVRPSLTVLGLRDGEHSDALVVGELHSRMDALNEWSRLSSVSSDRETDALRRIQSVTMTLHEDDGIAWQQGDATMRIRAGWFHSTGEDGYDRKTTVMDNVRIESVFDSGPRAFWDHFVEQRKVANLLVFLFGRPLSFREHRLRDDRFALRSQDGHIYGHPFVEIISRHTYQERITEIPSQMDLGRPLAFLKEVGADGLENWSETYETWKRFILPSLGVLGRTGRFIEDIVISTSMSIEAAGTLLGEQPGEDATLTRRGKPRPTTATYAYRCLAVLDVRWPDRIDDRLGLSRAIAKNYNSMKHYDRGDFPDLAESHVVSSVNQMIVRLLALHLTGRGEELLARFRKSNELYEIEQALDAYGIRVDENGEWSS